MYKIIFGSFFLLVFELIAIDFIMNNLMNPNDQEVVILLSGVASLFAGTIVLSQVSKEFLIATKIWLAVLFFGPVIYILYDAFGSVNLDLEKFLLIFLYCLLIGAVVSIPFFILFLFTFSFIYKKYLRKKHIKAFLILITSIFTLTPIFLFYLFLILLGGNARLDLSISLSYMIIILISVSLTNLKAPPNPVST